MVASRSGADSVQNEPKISSHARGKSHGRPLGLCQESSGAGSRSSAGES